MTKLSVVDIPRKLREHRFHPRHTLRLSPDDGVEFRCNGCKLTSVGGARYQCGRRACDVDLHVGCALAPRERDIGGFTFHLLHKPPAPAAGRVCDVCGDDARGFVYHCFELGHDLHPLCAEPSFQLAGLYFELRSEEPPTGCCCAYCHKKIPRRRCRCRRRHGRDAWYYLCNGGGEAASSLHVGCAKVVASKGFTNVPLKAACDKALAYASKSAAAAGDVFTVVSKGRKDVVTVSAQALRTLLLKKQQGGGRRGGALERSLRVLGFIARVVIGVIFGDPTAMIAAVAGVVFSGGC